jgi:HAD superfamily hydrolase (TIGR01509 family)
MRKERPMLEALIFDVDGVVAETEDLHRRAFNLAFARHGIGLSWDAREYRRLLRVAGGKERIARALAEHESPLPAEEVGRVHATKTAFYESILTAEGAPWRPGVARLMREARSRGLRLAIATTTTDANLDALFAPVLGCAWRSGFAAIVAGDAVARKKPAADVYLHALRRLAAKGERCIAIEDSAAGVQAARGAGCVVVSTRSRWLPDDDLRAADLQLEHLGDVGALWEREHPLVRQRWLSLKALVAWHRRHIEAQAVPAWPALAARPGARA